MSSEDIHIFVSIDDFSSAYKKRLQK